MKIEQALVAIGGRAERLRADGVAVPLSKSFMLAAGKPLLYWTLCSLHEAGIRSLVLAADREEQVTRAESVLSELPVTFSQVDWLRDNGLGTHGLPYYARDLLEENYIFECGHNILPSNHYKHLADLKTEATVAFSAFDPNPFNPRFPVSLNEGRVDLDTSVGFGIFTLATPFAVDVDYAYSLPGNKFDIVNVIHALVARDRLRYVYSSMPPEFDVRQELDVVMPMYERYVLESIRA